MTTVEDVLYQEARYYKLAEQDPRYVFFVPDTSALPHESMAHLPSYAGEQGTVILEKRVAEEITRHAETSKSARIYFGTDTRNVPRIALVGQRILKRLEDTHQTPRDVTKHPYAAREKAILTSAAKVLPKYAAYNHLAQKFPPLYDALAELEKPFRVEELRGSGTTAFAHAARVLASEPTTPAQRESLEYIGETRTGFLQSYRAQVATRLGPLATKETTLLGKRHLFIDHLLREASHGMDAILLRMMGNQVDPNYEGRRSESLGTLDYRFKMSACTQDTDIAVVMAAYLHQDRRRPILLSSDNDLRYLLRMRQMMDKHAHIPLPAHVTPSE